VKRKLKEVQSKFLQNTRPLIQELLETDLPRLERVLQEWLKDRQATPAALLAACAAAADRIPPTILAIHAGRQKYTHIRSNSRHLRASTQFWGIRATRRHRSRGAGVRSQRALCARGASATRQARSALLERRGCTPREECLHWKADIAPLKEMVKKLNTDLTNPTSGYVTGSAGGRGAVTRDHAILRQQRPGGSLHGTRR
jgi:hypothetical protein